MSTIAGARRVSAITLGPRTLTTLALATVVSVLAFGWPLLAAPDSDIVGGGHSADAPWVFALLLPLLIAIVWAEFADGALLGTDFSYNDFKQLQNAFGGFSAAQLDPETVAQRPAWVLSFKPVPDVKSAYTEVRTWVDQKTCVPLKTDFYEAGKLRHKKNTFNDFVDATDALLAQRRLPVEVEELLATRIEQDWPAGIVLTDDYAPYDLLIGRGAEPVPAGTSGSSQ